MSRKKAAPSVLREESAPYRAEVVAGRSLARTSDQPSFLDVFSGCGGLSLGFTAAGFQCLDGIETDPHAHETHARNFGGARSTHGPQDIRDLNARDYLGSRLPGKAAPTLIVGGPPCQPFTRVGRAKLREVSRLADAHLHDERVTFYEHFLRFVDELRPLAFVMENVPDLCRFAGRNIAEEIALTAADLGYAVRYTLLNSVWYGVPQMRERVVIVGLRRELGLTPRFPRRTHRLLLPRGYFTGRLANGAIPVLPPHDHYAGQPDEIARPRPAVTAREALSDLPPIFDHLEHMQARCGARRFNRPVEYAGPPANAYQRLMRKWPGFGEYGPPADHVIRFTPRDYETFRRMQPGDQYPQAYAVALERFEAALRREERTTGTRPREGAPRYEELNKSIVPPYDPAKFPNKWEKLDPDQPAHTVTAHLGKDSYSHIHYDNVQARMISVREAARLQSFPDGFHFAGTMNPAFRQIGNSVPPLMVLALAKSVREQLEQAGAIAHAWCKTADCPSTELVGLAYDSEHAVPSSMEENNAR
ncbi:MAG: DNA (cytosine-5-)-methyltransferase [Verrucomicrobia bacterium]|nr:DNA (cytosine-5-)-methyltransferase [Verrucomicrobiota bacterium]